MIFLIQILLLVNFTNIYLEGRGATPIPENLPPNTATSITLTWTATGDDKYTGIASEYDVRYSTSPIDSTNFSLCERILDTPCPKSAGSREVFIVDGLQPNTEYWFAIRVGDEVPNWSGITVSQPKRTAQYMVFSPLKDKRLIK